MLLAVFQAILGFTHLGLFVGNTFHSDFLNYLSIVMFSKGQ